MARVAGIDGYKSAWVCVTLDTENGQLSAAVLSAREFPVRRWDVAAIDVPIGLPDVRPRAADLEARRFLGAPRASSVFPCPYRPVLQSLTWEQMNEATRRLTGKGVSRQSFGILPKFREIDELARSSPEARQCLVEVHPEVTFAAWAGRPMRHGKKSAEGQRERRQLIDSHFGNEAFSSLRRRLGGAGVQDDDLADALAGLWTAERILRGEARSLPPAPEIDSEGLRMQIVY